MPKKPCREGYYRDKDGKCRRRGGYGGGALIYSPRRKKPKPDNGEPTNGDEQPTNGGPVQVLKLKDLLQNPLNRKIDRDKVDAIKRAINKTKVIKPLVYTEVMTEKGKEKMLTDGHHRYVALKEMGYRECPAVMEDERGVETAQHQKARAVRKLVTTLRNFVEKQARVGVTVPVVAKPKRPYSSPRVQTTQKHLQGQHDQSDHAPKTSRAGGALYGTVEGGAVHMATIAVPAAAVGALIRFAPGTRIGVIGVAAAFLLYEVPQLIFRMVEGGVRGYHGDRPYRLDVEKANTVDATGRAITRGDHMLVLYKDGANVGVSLGGDKVRLLNGKSFIDVKTTPKNRIKISTEDVVPSPDPKDAVRTQQVLEQLIKEQNVLMTLADQLKTRKITKHGSHDQSTHGGGKRPTMSRAGEREWASSIARSSIRDANRFGGGEMSHMNYVRQDVRRAGLKFSDEELRSIINENKPRKVSKHGSHNQKDHAPKGKGKKPEIRTIPYKGVEEGKHKEIELKNLAPAVADLKGNVYVGKRGQIHIDVIEGIEGFDENTFDRGFVDTSQGVYLTREQAGNLAAEDLLDNKKVTKHGSHNQQDHDPTKGRGQGALQQESRSRLRGSSKHKQLRRELESLASEPNKPGNKERMDAIHQELAAQAREARSEVRQEPKLAITTISDVKNHLGRGSKALISAERSNLSPDANAARTARLRQDLGAISNEVLESASRYGGSLERGFAASITAKQAQELSDRYNQESYIIIQGGKAQMKFRDGSSTEGSVSEATERVGAEDNYSTIGGVKFTIPFRDRTKERTKKLLKQLAELRDSITRANRMNKEGVTATNVSGLGLVREDLQDEMAHPHPGRRRKGWVTEDNFGLSQKMDMDEGVDTKHPYKNPEGAQIEGGRVSY